MKARHFELSLVAVSALMIFGISVPRTSFAAVSKAKSVLYFDVHDNIIGQRIMYCNNTAYHAGVTDSFNIYQIEFEAQCDDGINPGDLQLQITYFHSATGKSINYYCDQPHPVGTPFYGAPNCTFVPPQRDWNLSPWMSGWQ